MFDDTGRKALLYFFAKEKPRTFKLGKKALQKLIYIAQEAAEIPAGYRFVFYTYGPYSRDVSADLDVLEQVKILNITYDEALNSYEISAGKESQSLESWLQSHKTIKDRAAKVLNALKAENARTLELYSTLLYVTGAENVEQDSEIVQRVAELKPKYGPSEIREKLRTWRAKEAALH